VRDGGRPIGRLSIQRRLDLSSSRQAVVLQTTGEDWTGTKIKLSTSQPRLSPQGPEPNPWTLSVRPPRAPTAAPLTGRAAASEDLSGAARASTFTVSEIQSTFATEFEVPGKIDVPSDGRQVTVSLSKQVVPVKQRIRVVPRIDTSAFVVAEADRPEGIWLAGNIQNRSGDSGFLGNRTEREVGYTFTLTSMHKSPIEILILESSPVSTAPTPSR
jgi:hypothetical protein